MPTTSPSRCTRHSPTPPSTRLRRDGNPAACDYTPQPLVVRSTSRSLTTALGGPPPSPPAGVAADSHSCTDSPPKHTSNRTSKARLSVYDTPSRCSTPLSLRADTTAQIIGSALVIVTCIYRSPVALSWAPAYCRIGTGQFLGEDSYVRRNGRHRERRAVR